VGTASSDRRRRLLRTAALALVATTVLPPGLAIAKLVEPRQEQHNYAIGLERARAWETPQLQAQVTAAELQYQRARAAALAADPGRQPNPNSCTAVIACPIDPRLGNWTAHGGIVKPVLFTARDGATLSGHVWATRSGPAKRPGVLFINGSGIGYEQGYWFIAEALARGGFVVMTFDVQGEGMSDQFGQAPDRLEGAFAGTPVIGLASPQHTLGGSGLPFYDGGGDALDFLLSTAAHPYLPVPSRGTGTSHATKQIARVRAGLDSAYDPLWRMLDRSELGITGHSYGAQAASWLGQQDPRLKAAVALDSLCTPAWPALDELTSLGEAPINRIAGVAPGGAPYGFARDCFGAPQGPAPALTKPTLGLSGDYLLDYAPYVTDPEPNAKNLASDAYTQADVDTGQIVIRGGTHLDFGDTVGTPLPASLRGIDLTTWYTTAWFDKYLKHEPAADAMLTTSRWRDDLITGQVDPTHDPNMYSYHYLSRLDITLANGKRFACENVRGGCLGQTSRTTDCGPANYSFLPIDSGAETPNTCGRRSPSEHGP
jgi:predicted alpha/beta hydrolase